MILLVLSFVLEVSKPKRKTAVTLYKKFISVGNLLDFMTGVRP